MASLKSEGHSIPEIDEIAANLKRKANISGLRVLYEPVWQGDEQIGPKGQVEYSRLLLSLVSSISLPAADRYTPGGEHKSVSFYQATDLKAEGVQLYKNHDTQVDSPFCLIFHPVLAVLELGTVTGLEEVSVEF